MKKNVKKVDKNEELKDLKKKLFYKKENVYDNRTKKAAKETERYAKGYMKFLDDAKTERECVDVAVKQFQLAHEDKGEHIACLEARKHFAWYLRGVSHSNYYKEQISAIQSVDDIYRIADGIRRDLK